MTEAKWYKSEVKESGNFPKNSFKGVLESIYIAENDNLDGAQELTFKFTDGKQIATLMFNKERSRGVMLQDGHVIVDGKKISTFIASIERLDAKTGSVNMNNNDPSIVRIQTEWAFDDEGIPRGFRTVPDLTGCTLSMIATLDKVGDDQQTSKYPDWTVGQVEGLNASKPAAPPKGKVPAAPKPIPKGKAAPANEACMTDVEDLMLEGLTAVGDIYARLGGAGKSPYKPAEIREAIAAIQAKGT